jgi:thioredoxin-related protein
MQKLFCIKYYYILLSLACFVFYLPSSGQDSIHFKQLQPYTVSIDSTLNYDKPVFVYFWMKGCGPCIKLKKTTFTDTAVVRILNSGFTCYTVNLRDSVNMSFRNNYYVNAAPTLLLLNNKCELICKKIGYLAPSDLIDLLHGFNIEKIKSLSDYKKKYQEGCRDPEFLYDYCYMLKDAREIGSVVVTDYLHALPDSDFYEPDNIRFIFEFMLGKSITPYINFRNPAAQFMINHTDLFYREFDKEQVDFRIYLLSSCEAFLAASLQDKARFDAAIKVLENYDADTSRSWWVKDVDNKIMGGCVFKSNALTEKMYYCEVANDKKNYCKYEKLYIKSIWKYWNELNDFANKKYHMQFSKDLHIALSCAQHSAKLHPDYKNLLLIANINYTSKRYAKALQYSNKAIEAARQNNLPYGDAEKLIIQVNSEKSKK